MKIFSDSEEEQLQQLLALTSRSDLSTLLDAASYIFEQAAYRNCSGAVLQAALQENALLEPQVYLVLGIKILYLITFITIVYLLGSNTILNIHKLIQAIAFGTSWSEKGPSYVSLLRDRTLGAPQV